MDLRAFELNDFEFEWLSDALEQKARHLKAHHLEHLAPFFDIGDRVGFLYGTGERDHSTGVITHCGEQFTTVKTDNGISHRVSPFLIFALKGYCEEE